MSTWTERCELTAHKIIRRGFDIEYLHGMTSVKIGTELGTGVYLMVSAGVKSVRNVRHTTVGISEGLRDMAQDGLEGKMILYGLGFQFMRS
ncbi:hypothetical protein F5X99DRAFT_422515 [Biscogniauxia marginata]|nr:hypothetical protein F5X99DRAFT_422515 [Biscogniauxia marginata]